MNCILQEFARASFATINFSIRLFYTYSRLLLISHFDAEFYAL